MAKKVYNLKNSADSSTPYEQNAHTDDFPITQNRTVLSVIGLLTSVCSVLAFLAAIFDWFHFVYMIYVATGICVLSIVICAFATNSRRNYLAVFSLVLSCAALIPSLFFSISCVAIDVLNPFK